MRREPTRAEHKLWQHLRTLLSRANPSSATTSPISPAARLGSSSKLTAASTQRLRLTRSAPAIWKGRGGRCSASGTTTCSGTRTGSWQRSSKRWRAPHPTPNPSLAGRGVSPFLHATRQPNSPRSFSAPNITPRAHLRRAVTFATFRAYSGVPTTTQARNISNPANRFDRNRVSAPALSSGASVATCHAR